MSTQRLRTETPLSQGPCVSPCTLCDLLARGRFGDIQEALHHYVWRRFCSDDQLAEHIHLNSQLIHYGHDPTEHRASPTFWMLCSAVFAGCPATAAWCVEGTNWDTQSQAELEQHVFKEKVRAEETNADFVDSSRVYGHHEENNFGSDDKGNHRENGPCGIVSSFPPVESIGVDVDEDTVHKSVLWGLPETQSTSQLETSVISGQVETKLEMIDRQSGDVTTEPSACQGVTPKDINHGTCHLDTKPTDTTVIQSTENLQRDENINFLETNNQGDEVRSFDPPETESRDVLWKNVLNTRISCEFPLTDTWIRQTINLCIAPLHLACWRLDHHLIHLLLTKGADPNLLAMEEVLWTAGNGSKTTQEDVLEWKTAAARNDVDSENPRRHPFPDDRREASIPIDGKFFHKNQGLSPLHFLALGIRSSPIHSVQDGARSRVVKTYKEQDDVLGSSCPEWAEAVLSRYSDQLSSSWESPSLKANGEEKLMQMRIILCLETLVSHGAQLNQGCSGHLQSLFPLDIVLQPPLKVYYAPSMARASQNSEALRLQNLNHNASLIHVACHVMMQQGAHLSPDFLFLHRWRPALLDCFRLYDVNLAELFVVHLFRLGIFSETDPFNGVEIASGAAVSTNHKESVDENVSFRFVADIMNTHIDPLILSFVCHWLSPENLNSLLKHLEGKGRGVAENEEEVVQLVRTISLAQIRTLAHSAALVILKSTSFSFTAIQSLPLPMRMKQNLHVLNF